jgi:hypothetical protein
MPNQRILTGTARPHFQTESMNTLSVRDYFSSLGINESDTVKIGKIHYQIFPNGEQMVTTQSSEPDAADAELTRDGDYIYTLSLNVSANNFKGALTSAIAQADQKISDLYGGN